MTALQLSSLLRSYYLYLYYLYYVEMQQGFYFHVLFLESYFGLHKIVFFGIVFVLHFFKLSGKFFFFFKKWLLLNLVLSENKLLHKCNIFIIYWSILEVRTFPKKSFTHSVHPPCRKSDPPTKFSKMGGLTGRQLLERGCWERVGNFFQGRGCNFHIKKSIKIWNI